MTEIDDSQLDELWAPFEALKPFFDVRNLSPERFTAANEGIIADLVGDAPQAIPASDLDAETLALMYALINVYSPIGRFDVYQKMFKYYPWRNRFRRR
jgi:hypothetical protein